jgi:aminoglycoside phosphotransferase (APT) family kinase protein
MDVPVWSDGMVPSVSNDEPVDAILAHHGLRGSWQELPATGIANRIYATRDVVLRIARDCSEAIEDARTESVAAPVARAAGLLVPQMLVFDDSRSLLNRPYSIWERIHGETLGQFMPDPRKCLATWEAAGRQLALLHNTVEDCPDPHGWLDHPAREPNLEDRIAMLVAASNLDSAVVSRMEYLAKALRPAVEGALPIRFLHNDLHAMNLMCSRDGQLLAVLDWGDAGWGDPALELAQVPLAAIPAVLRGYRSKAQLDSAAEARILWDKLCEAVEDLESGAVQSGILEDLFDFARGIV